MVIDDGHVRKHCQQPGHYLVRSQPGQVSAGRRFKDGQAASIDVNGEEVGRAGEAHGFL